MARVRIALAQVNPTVGDLLGNRALVVETAAAAARRGAHLVAFPEMALPGYPVEDLALRASFQAACRASLDHLAADLEAVGCGDVAVVVGCLLPSPGPADRRGFNAAAVIHHGRVVAEYHKHHLPNYGVFDEQRYFRAGSDPCVLRIGGADVALAVCEDIWRTDGPVSDLAGHPPGALIVLNGSPYELAKDDRRFELCAQRARQVGCSLAYVNLWGGQDELVFDGDSLIVDADGNLLARSPQFVEDLLVVDLHLPPGTRDDAIPLDVAGAPDDHELGHIADPLSDAREVYLALMTGLRDYAAKNGFTSVVLGMSGGIDSALVASIACDALGPDNVHGVRMPGEFSSEHSLSDAADSAARTGLPLRTVPITDVVATYHAHLELSGLAAENLQARVRGTLLMAISNSEGHLVLATGNKSELSVGYSTIYGDAVGGFAPIKDVPKSLVWRMAAWRNEAAENAGQVPPIPPNSIAKPPSAELRPGQVDSDSLPDYAVLDAVLEGYVEGDLGAQGLAESGHDVDLVSHVLRLTDAAEWKRRQYPPGPKISYRAFGRDRRLPITNRWREQLD